MRTSQLLSTTLLLLFALTSAKAQTSYPMITHTLPVAVQRGKTTEVSVVGRMNFFGVYKALFEGDGISAEGLPPAPTTPPPRAAVTSVKVKLKVAANAILGPRDFRLASSLGMSSIGQVLVVDHPVQQEAGVNNTLDKANAIVKVPSAVCGRIEVAEDVDFFKFHADKGQTLTFEVQCARLQDRIHDLQKHADPMLTLFDGSGRELAASDDFYFADPYLSYTIPESGDYYIQVRDSKYDGDARWVYALLVSSSPCVSHVFPLAGNPGQTMRVEPVGSAGLIEKQVAITLPSQEGIHTLPVTIKGQPTNPTAIVVSSLPQVIEKEDNDALEKAMRVQLPCGINGRIGQERDLDCYVFKGFKGKAITLEIKARRFGTSLLSSLDSVLEVMTPQGKVLKSNDDSFGKDAALEFTPPSDGDYVVRVRDLNSKGGPTAVYYLEADWAQPDFTLRCDPDKAMIGPGSSTAWYVHVNRVNGCTSPIQIEVKGLPQGVTVNPLTIPPTMTQGLLVLTAGPNAPREGVSVEVLGTATVKGPDGKERTLLRRCMPNQEIYLPGGGRGVFDVALQSVAVTDASDILKVEVTPKQIQLKPGQEVRLEVTIHRQKDYDKGVSLDVVLQHLGRVYGNPLPPGVTVVAGKSKTLLGTGSKGHIVLKAAANASPIENIPISVLAHVSVNFVVKVSYSSPAIPLSVQK